MSDDDLVERATPILSTAIPKPTTIPLGRGGDAEEVVGAALYLASSASSYTTGSIIKIDGEMAWAPA